MNRLTVPESPFERLLQGALSRPSGAMRFPVGRSRTSHGVEMLAGVASRGRLQGAEEGELIVRNGNARFDEQGPPTLVRLWIDRTSDLHAAGAVWFEDRWNNLDELVVVGAGLRRIPLPPMNS